MAFGFSYRSEKLAQLKERALRTMAKAPEGKANGDDAASPSPAPEAGDGDDAPMEDDAAGGDDAVGGKRESKGEGSPPAKSNGASSSSSGYAF